MYILKCNLYKNTLYTLYTVFIQKTIKSCRGIDRLSIPIIWALFQIARLIGSLGGLLGDLGLCPTEGMLSTDGLHLLWLMDLLLLWWLLDLMDWLRLPRLGLRDWLPPATTRTGGLTMPVTTGTAWLTAPATTKTGDLLRLSICEVPLSMDENLFGGGQLNSGLICKCDVFNGFCTFRQCLLNSRRLIWLASLITWQYFGRLLIHLNFFL